MKPVKTILHPTDFSGHSREALRLACTLARADGSHLVILHVVPPHVPFKGCVEELPEAQRSEVDLASYREEMREKLERLPLPWLTGQAERLLEEGDAADVILDTAKKVSCDLIVMGTHGWSEEGRRVLGSVAEAVAQNAHCRDVTVRVPLDLNDAERPTTQEVGVIL
jgi:nucleotide-binding universal stress UspA family protein